MEEMEKDFFMAFDHSVITRGIRTTTHPDSFTVVFEITLLAGEFYRWLLEYSLGMIVCAIVHGNILCGYDSHSEQQ